MVRQGRCVMPQNNTVQLSQSGREQAFLFSSGLLAPDSPVPKDLRSPQGTVLADRYNIYRNNVTVSLINAVASIFPAVQRITGPDFFRAMARFYIRAKPPSSPLLFEYGRDFAEFIEAYEYAQTMPWLPDVARIERAWLDAYHAADADGLDPARLAAIPQERVGLIRFTMHPATRIVRSLYPAVSIFSQNRADGEVLPVNDRPEDALITRSGNQVQVRLLDAGAAEFLLALSDGAHLQDAAQVGLGLNPDLDLARLIAVMLEANVFSSLEMDHIDD